MTTAFKSYPEIRAQIVPANADMLQALKMAERFIFEELQERREHSGTLAEILHIAQAEDALIGVQRAIKGARL